MFKSTNIYILFIALFIHKNMSSQVAGISTDVFVNIVYKQLLGEVKSLALKDAATFGSALAIDQAIGYEANSIVVPNPFITAQGVILSEFIYDDSMGYIEEKYPLIPKIGYENNNAFGNVLTREIFKRKLTKEKENIDNYVNPLNPISEGERIYLILSAIENVIETTLENEGL